MSFGHESTLFQGGLCAFDRKGYIAPGAVVFAILGKRQRHLITLSYSYIIPRSPGATTLYFPPLFQSPGATSFGLRYKSYTLGAVSS
jgi:hypothetical protein